MPRFIPAGAGNTFVLSRIAAEIAVHPRWRGEHVNRAVAGSNPAGSSPLARGTRQAAVGVDAGLRFIPAGAGNTSAKG